MLKALSVLFALFGICSMYVAVHVHAYSYAIGAVVALAAAFGLWLRKHWSQYFVYLSSAAFIAEWFWLLWRAIQNNQWPYSGMLQSIIALIPGILLVALAGAVSGIAYRGFRVRS
jgi:uncharacterized membrane protein (DUF2068 family)